MLLMTFSVCCGAARSTVPSGGALCLSRQVLPVHFEQVPRLSGGVRPAFSLCYSGPCPSGLWGSPEGFTPLVAFHGTYGSGRNQGNRVILAPIQKPRSELSLAGVCGRYGFGCMA